MTEIKRKLIGVPLTKVADGEQSDGSYLVRGKFTSDNRDEVGDIITRGATERAVPKYRRWGNIRYMHMPQPVGRVTRIGSDDGLEWNEVEIRVIDPKAVFEVQNGLLQALSVGILINYEDIEPLADGGWVINDYALAEISLVDHPANYDATLDLNLNLTDAIRAKAREFGLISTLKEMGIPVPGEQSMPENKDAGLAEEIAEVVTPQADAPVAETPVIEDAPAAEEVPAVEAPVAEAPAVEEPVVAETPAPVAEVTPAPAQPVELASMADLLKSFTDAMATAAAAISEAAKAIHSINPVEPKVEEAKALTNGQSTDEAKTEHEKELEKQVADLTVQVADLSKPADRKGALPVEETPVPEVTETETPRAKNSAIGMREAVKRYLTTKE